jgi:hypothetical protein
VTTENAGLPWDEWRKRLEELLGVSYGPRGPIDECGEACWREFYDLGYSPEEAADDDRGNWEE